MKKFAIPSESLTYIMRRYAELDRELQVRMGEEVYVGLIVIAADGSKSLVMSAEQLSPELAKQAIDLKAERANWAIETTGEVRSITKEQA